MHSSIPLSVCYQRSVQSRWSVYLGVYVISGEAHACEFRSGAHLRFDGGSCQAMDGAADDGLGLTRLIYF